MRGSRRAATRDASRRCWLERLNRRTGETRSCRSRALTLLATALANAANAAGAPDPGHYIPAPPDASVAALYAQRREADKVYADNERVAGDLGLRLHVGVARFMHCFEWMGKPADVELINDTNLMLTWAQQVTEAMQLQLQYAQDVKVRMARP
jgi:hypothetical protein